MGRRWVWLCGAGIASVLIRMVWDWLGGHGYPLKMAPDDGGGETFGMETHTNPCLSNQYCYLYAAYFSSSNSNNNNGTTITTATQCFEPGRLSVKAVELGPNRGAAAVTILATCPPPSPSGKGGKSCLPGLAIYKEPHAFHHPSARNVLMDDVWIIFARLWHLGEHGDAARVRVVMHTEHRRSFTHRLDAEYYGLLTTHDLVLLNASSTSTSAPSPCFERLVVGWARDSVTFGSPAHLVHLPLVAAFRRRALQHAGVSALPEHRGGEQLCSVVLVSTHIANAAELAAALRSRCVVDVVDVDGGTVSLKALVRLLATRRVLITAVDAAAAHGLFQPRHSGVVVLVAPAFNGTSPAVRHLLAKIPFRRYTEVVAGDGGHVQWSRGRATWRPAHLLRVVGEVVAGVRDDLRLWPYEGDEAGAMQG